MPVLRLQLPRPGAHPETRFRDALCRELAWEAARLGQRKLGSVFFGGGTPSLMEPQTVAALLDDARRLFTPVPDLEVTLEANPTTVEADRLCRLPRRRRQPRLPGRAKPGPGGAGLTWPPAQRGPGRRRAGNRAPVFPRLSFDLIYARPGQDRASWTAELRTALALAADHLSLYQLTIEPGTRFESLHRRGEIVLPDPDTAADLYQITADQAARFGLRPYEVSNYAAPGAESRHNLTYWRYGDYAGIGPGAHGRLTLNGALCATRRHRAPEPWAERVENGGHGTVEEAALTPEDRAREMLLMGLRLTEGIDLCRFADRTGTALEDAVDSGILAQAIDENYLCLTPDRLTATAEGRLRLDALLAALVR